MRYPLLSLFFLLPRSNARAWTYLSKWLLPIFSLFLYSDDVILCRYFWSNLFGALKEKPLFRDPYTVKWGAPQSDANFSTPKLKNVIPGEMHSKHNWCVFSSVWDYLSAILLKVEIIVRIILHHMFHADLHFEVVIFSKPCCQLINKSWC